MLFAHTPIARLARRLWADRASMQRERLINTRPKRDLCKQEQLEVGAAKWERGSFGGEVSLRPPSKEGVGTVAFSVAFILILRRKVISVLVTRFDNICNNFIRLTPVE